MFVYVAVGTRFNAKPKTRVPDFHFASLDAEAMQTPLVLDRLGLWAVAAIAIAIIAYAGPIHEQLSQHHYLAPGMRTW
jgi:hypothetical protein